MTTWNDSIIFSQGSGHFGGIKGTMNLYTYDAFDCYYKDILLNDLTYSEVIKLMVREERKKKLIEIF